MRLVRAKRDDSRPAPPALPPAAGLLPSAEELEAARHMSVRFAPAGLREVRLVQLPGRRVWLALESMQVTGSFKVRGALLAIERRLAAFRARPGADATQPFVIIAASAGNHGVGVAHAAKHLGARAEVVVPRGAPRTKVRKMEAAGAKVIESASAGYDGAEAEAIQLARDRGLPFLSPYDDIDVIVGNGASLGFEIVRALGRVPGRVHCPIGGGGLATGLACALHHERGDREAATRVPIVVPAQSEASCAFALSLERGAAVTELPPATTLAEGCEGGIPDRAFARASALIDSAVVCTEEEIAAAMRHAVRELGLIIEGSAAVALVPALGSGFTEAEDADVVIVLTGRNVDADRLTTMLC